MDTIRFDVKNIGSEQRRTLEQMIGRQLAQDEQLVIVVSPGESDSKQPVSQPALLPEWCNVFEGLGDESLAEIEKSALSRADLSRTFQ